MHIIVLEEQSDEVLLKLNENGCFEEGYGESQCSELLEKYGFDEG